MGEFRSNGPRRDFGGGRPSGNRFGGGRSSGGFGGNRGGFGGERRSFGGRDGARSEMHEVTCDKCGKQCRVPFKPSGGKPVYCSDCFRQNEGGSSNNFRSNGSRGNDRPQQASGMTSEQFNQLNAKLDKILAALAEFAEEDADDELDADMDLDSDDEDAKAE